jgi:predicted secreted hydrolase
MGREPSDGRREAQSGRRPDARGRRRFLSAFGAILLGASASRGRSQVRGAIEPLTPPSAGDPPAAHLPGFAPVVPGYRIRFPQDEGSHPRFRTEWWYITGWLQRASGAAGAAQIGFQITFFRARLDVDERNPSAFAPRQIIIAHAALSDPSRGRLLHDQKVARTAFDLAGADEGRTRVWIDDWSLTQGAATYSAAIPARDFALAMQFTPTQPPLLQGQDGFSRKGPREESASYYYSFPHLRVSGTVAEKAGDTSVAGSAWLDHEWSSSYMDERAAGWDWIGINLEDGGAVMAFRMRDAREETFWAGGTYRAANGMRRAFSEREVRFVPLRWWRSPRTGVRYPIAWRVELPALTLAIEPMMDDQENDTRLSIGTIYWEGAVIAMAEGKPIGRGYLELAGYWQKLRV